ncbi:MAG TPA: hypothetical protein VF116_15230 [Ktedonobacterales bacterium]
MADSNDLVVKEYTGNDRARKYEADVRELVRQGWVVLSATDLEIRPGCLNLIGPFKNIFAPQLKLRVTYMRPVATAE